jgi:hypothetical protein
MLARAFDEEDYDLAVEILLSWPLTGNSWSAISTFAFRVLRNVEDKVGSLPTSSTRIATLERLAGSSSLAGRVRSASPGRKRVRTAFFLRCDQHTAENFGRLSHNTKAQNFVDYAVIPNLSE